MNDEGGFPGPALSAFIRQHAADDVRTLSLQMSRFGERERRFVLQQIAGRQAAQRKLPSWAAMDGLRYPSHLPMEQCSSEATARYKATVIERIGIGRGTSGAGDGRFVDLTGGFGVDCHYIARLFAHAVYVERNEELAATVRLNYDLLGNGHIPIIIGDGVEYLRTMPHADWVLIDPARRDEHGSRTVALSDCSPDVTLLTDLLQAKADRTLLKLSPMIDIAEAVRLLPQTVEADVVAVEGECKEVLLIMETGTRKVDADAMPICCVNLRNDGRVIGQPFVFTREEEREAAQHVTHEAHAEGPIVGAYLFEPHAALMKAGAFRTIALRYGLSRLHPNSHLYTSAEPKPEFPGRQFRITGTYGLSKSELRRLKSEVPKANLSVRNFPMSAAELRHRTGLRDGGDHYLFATTLSDGARVLLDCRKE